MAGPRPLSPVERHALEPDVRFDGGDDCGFATFADNPVAAPDVAEAKLRAIAGAAETLRRG